MKPIRPSNPAAYPRAAGGAPLEVGDGVARGLGLDSGDVLPRCVALGLDDADRLAVDEQHIIGGAAVGGVFPDRDARGCAEVELFHVLHGPARLLQTGIDAAAGPGFWRHEQRSGGTNRWDFNANTRSFPLLDAKAPGVTGRYIKKSS